MSRILTALALLALGACSTMLPPSDAAVCEAATDVSTAIDAFESALAANDQGDVQRAKAYLEEGHTLMVEAWRRLEDAELRDTNGWTHVHQAAGLAGSAFPEVGETIFPAWELRFEDPPPREHAMQELVLARDQLALAAEHLPAWCFATD